MRKLLILLVLSMFAFGPAIAAPDVEKAKVTKKVDKKDKKVKKSKKVVKKDKVK